MNRNPEYIFNQAIQNRLKSFKSYLQELGHDTNTIRQKMNYTGYFMKWLENEKLDITETKYNDLLVFIDHCRNTGKSKKHINSFLRAIRNYYEHLKQTDETLINPATNLYLRGERHKLPHDILTIETLESLYNSYPVIDNRTRRNKTMLGMFIYQGITTGELMNLQTNHVKLQEGKIYVPASKQSNSRNLELKPFQVLDLYEYINHIRPELIKESTDQLFISMEGNRNIKNSVHHLFRALKRINPDIKNVKQIRASVITNWLKHYNLRQVQYFAGHRYVSSTERYQLNNLEGLKNEIDKYHPLN